MSIATEVDWLARCQKVPVGRYPVSGELSAEELQFYSRQGRDLHDEAVKAALRWVGGKILAALRGAACALGQTSPIIEKFDPTPADRRD